MYRSQHAPAPRKGIILLVVLALLTLFTIIGISFVLYADAAAKQAQTGKEANVEFRPNMSPEECLSLFLDQLIFDVRDDESGVYSSLRGHSLSRNMYGFNYDWADQIYAGVRTQLAGGLLDAASTTTTTTITVNAAAGFPTAPRFLILVDNNEQMTVTAMNNTDPRTWTWTVTRQSTGVAHNAGALVTIVASPSDYIAQIGNDVPFNGVGRLHYNTTVPGATAPVDDWKMINYMYFQQDGFLRDPERYGARAGLRAPGAPDNRGPYLASANVSYTYADINNFYLGAIDGSGNLLTPSFHREWLFGQLDQRSNANWTNTAGKYLTMRPRPVDQLLQSDVVGAGLPWPLVPDNLTPAQQATLASLINRLQANGQLLPYPGDRGGDIKNLVGYPGGNDSSWIDIGAPVMTAPDGRKYKMLVAPLILDLDGRLNVNVHGNTMKADPANPASLANPHGSNQGLGPWEVNLGRLLTAPTAGGQIEWVQLFNGRTNPTIYGRYGPNKVPLINIVPASNVAPAIPVPHYYSQLDYTGRGVGPIQMPTGLTNPFPTYQGTGYDNANPAARTNHAMLDQVLSPLAPRLDATGAPSQYWNRRFPASNVERLFRWQDTGYEALTSDLERLLPLNLVNAKVRNLLTTDSGDRNRPGIAPYIFDPAAAPYTYGTATGATLEGPPVGVQPVFPPLTNPVPRVGSGSEFMTDLRQRPDWRSALTATATVTATGTVGRGLTRLDVNYPVPNATSATGAPQPLIQYPNNANAPDQRYDTNAVLVAATPTAPAVTYADRFLQAQRERQIMARQIYLRLLAVTGLSPSAGPAPSDVDLRPRRWLAQVAVNMVDFIDRDDVSTAFNFYTAEDAGPAAVNFDVGAATTLPGPVTAGPNPNPQGVLTPRYWVFGTELPRVVINEVLAEYTPDPAPTAGTTKFDNNVWVELLAPVSDNHTNPNTGRNTMDDRQAWLGMPALPNGQTPQTGFGANGYAAYQLVIADQIMLPSLPPPGGQAIPENNNVLGMPLKIRSQTVIGDFGPGTVLNMSTGNPSNPGQTAAIQPGNFLIVAPPPTATSGNFRYGVDVHKTIAVNNQTTFPDGSVPANTPVYSAAGMQYSSTYDTATTFMPDDTKTGITVMLQRLANPHIPPDNRPTINGVVNLWYNPYITIDYVQNVPLNNSTQQSYASVGKKQPYASRMVATGVGTGPVVPTATSLVVNQNGLTAVAVQHTFGKSNNTTAATSPAAAPGANSKYDWLPHLDRLVTSPLELVHVSQYQPHQLTQKFMKEDAAPVAANAALRFQHAPLSTWYDPTRRLYRLFEFLEVRNRALGSSNASEDGRITGKININSIWDLETFRALCDAQGTNNFTQADVDAIWAQLLKLRSPIYANNNPGMTTFTQFGSLVGPTNLTGAVVDRPFLGQGAGHFPLGTTPQYPQGQDINDTLFRTFAPNTSTPTDARLFDIPPPRSTTLANTDINPYIQTELMRKIFNNVTTRSNVFAVWVTVGFFEVKDDTARPVKLGAEMNAAEGKAVRHRMFAVVDRSLLPANPYPSVPTRNQTVLPPKTQFRPSAPASTLITSPVDLRGLVPHWSVVD
jgi:hypothetical protein